MTAIGLDDSEVFGADARGDGAGAHSAYPPVLRVGDLARQTGKTVRAIHLYEQLGLVHPRTRSKGKYRLFGPDAVVRIRWITKLQQLGMSLSDIAAFVEQCEASSGPGAMRSVRDVYAQQLQQTRVQMQRLQALARELTSSLEYLDQHKDQCKQCDSGVLLNDCHRCHNDSRDPEPPVLIAGLYAQFSSASAAHSSRCSATYAKRHSEEDGGGSSPVRVSRRLVSPLSGKHDLRPPVSVNSPVDFTANRS